MMRWSLVWMLLVSMVHGAEEKLDSVQRQAVGTKGASSKVRISGGLGMGTFGTVAEGRILMGPKGTNLRFGAQFTQMEEIAILVSPSQDLSIWSVVVGWEFSDEPWLSVMPFAQTGVARGYLARDTKNRGGEFEVREMERAYNPVLMSGIDVGVSLDRSAGISMQVGGLFSRIRSGYAALQLDVGVW